MTRRTGSYRWQSRETEITCTVDLEGGPVEVTTNHPLLTHFLTALARHGMLGLMFLGQGDVEVDPHHLVEDAGRSLGEALTAALGDRAGIERAGFWLMPMDECLVRVALDLSGRAHAVVEGFGADPVGGATGEAWTGFFWGLARGARANLHVDLVRGGGAHHAWEAAFKATGRAIRQACRPVDSPEPLSTKGQLR